MRMTLIALPAALLLGMGLAHAQPAMQPTAPTQPTQPTQPGWGAGAGMAGARPHGVTREQFIKNVTAMAGKRFDEMDTNHDGIIEPAERQAWLAAHPRPGADLGSITVHSAPSTNQ